MVQYQPREGCVKAVEKGLASLRRASEMYGIPKSTLHDYLTGKVQFGARPGPTPYLSHGEEEELSSFLVQVATIGYPRSKREVLALVHQIVENKGIDTSVTNGWWEILCKVRFQELPTVCLILGG